MSWAVVGAEVVERSRSWGAFPNYGPVKKIAKVYKTGNFTLDGETQQWRRIGDYARKTGDVGIHSNATIVPVTAEIRAEMEQAKQYASAVKVVQTEAERLEKVWRARDVDETIAEAARIVDAAEGRS